MNDDDPNAIGPLVSPHSGVRPCRYFLNRTRPGETQSKAAFGIPNGSVDVWCDIDGEHGRWVNAPNWKVADALLARLYPPRPPTPKNFAGPTHVLIAPDPDEKPVTLLLLSGMPAAPSPSAEDVSRAMREATITGVAMALAKAVEIAVKRRLPTVARQIAAAGEALVAQIRSQPPTGGADGV